MPKILIYTICMVVMLISSAVQSNAQCYSKEVVNGKNILRGTPDYIYVRADTTYLGMTFTVEKDENNIYKIAIKTDASNDFAAPDSAVFVMDNNSFVTIALGPGVTSIGDGNLLSTTNSVDISLSDLQRIQGRKVTNVNAYRKGKKIDLPVYDEGFFIQQLNCLKVISKAGK